MEEIYIIKETDENTWTIFDENGSIIRAITKENVADYCKRECETSDTEWMSAKDMVESIWWEMHDDYDLELIDNYCQEFDKFLAWFDYICVEYLAKEMVAFYKQKLLNFE